MKTAEIERWLVKQTWSEALLNLPVGAICLGASLVVLALTALFVGCVSLVVFIVVAALARSFLDQRLREPFFFCAFCSGAFLLWLFVSHYRRNAEHLRFAKYRTAKVHVSDAGFARALNVLLSDPRHDDDFFQRLLYTGPRWFVAGLSMFYKSLTLLQMDIACCAEILLVLFQKGARVSLTELARLVPNCNSVKIFPQLRDIAGVIFLQNEPTGISLTSDLRAELARVLGVPLRTEPAPRFYRQTKSAPPPPRPPPPPKPLVEEPPGPHKILGVSRSASLAEIKAAYRKQIKQCHPDRFATLNKDWQEMAEQRAKIVNEAYAVLTAQAAGRRTRV